jgi:hypothetical protein
MSNANHKKAYASSFVSTLSENQNNISSFSSKTTRTHGIGNSTSEIK